MFANQTWILHVEHSASVNPAHNPPVTESASDFAGGERRKLFIGNQIEPVYWLAGTAFAVPKAMESQLTRILASTRRDVEQRKASTSLRGLEQAAAAHQPRGFARALRAKAKSGPAIIAELKKASPSKGLIRPDFNVAAWLRAMIAGEPPPSRC